MHQILLFVLPSILLNDDRALPSLATDNVEDNSQAFAPESTTSESLAFLQYISGSTKTPKGVINNRLLAEVRE